MTDSASTDRIDALLEQHLPGLRAFVRLRTGPAIRKREAASDLVQSVCREVLQNADRFWIGGERGFKRWLYQTALRKIAHRAEYHQAARRDQRRDATEDELAACYASICTPSRHASAREQLARIEGAFDALSDEHRDVLIGVRLLGMSYAELAAQTGKSEGALRTTLWRATARLTELVDEAEARG